MLRFRRAMIYLTIVFLFTSMLVDAMCSTDVSRVLRTRLSRTPVSRITCHQLMYSYVSRSISRVSLLVRIWTDDSSPVTCLFHVSPFVLSTRLCLPLLLMPFLL